MGPIDVEALLERERRASLPLIRQLLLYLDPFALFKDTSRGSWLAREAALSYNRAMRWMLLAYVRRWLFIAATSFLAIAPAEAAASQASIFIIPAAAFAVGCSIAVAVCALTVAVYLLLGTTR
ncbi:MAG: hypothetical protein ABR570_15575 [Burkholderiales bacterium]